MAGAGYKLFATGDVLTAAQVNTYLMQQTVMVFASSAARTTALSGVLAEGMVSYLQDTNTLEVYDGSAWVGATGDITGLTAGTGISISSATGPVPTVTNAMATEITAKGDLIVGTGSATFDNLAAGSNGDTLVADSSTSTGLRYQAPKTQNAIYNSGFDIAQRGTSFTALAGADYTLDRWVMWSTSGGQSNYVSQQSVGNLSVTPNQAIRYCGRFGRTSGTTNTGGRQIFQSLETADSVRLAGQTVTLSYYARAGANFSGGSNQISAEIVTGTGTDQIKYSYTGGVQAGVGNAALTTSWQRFSVTATLATTTTEVSVGFLWTPTGTAGAADYFEITGVQLETGSVATPYNRMSATVQGELAACQRYFQLITGFGDTAGVWYTTSAASLSYKCPVLMRTTPTPTFNTTYTNAVDQVGIALRTPTGYSAAYSGITGITFLATGASGATIGYPAIYVGGTHQLSAEL